MQYGNVRVGQWLGSIVTGFFASIFLTQPLKVISLALLFMCFCRKQNNVEAFIEEEDPIADFTVSAEDARRKFPVRSEKNVFCLHCRLFVRLKANSVLARTRLDPQRPKREQTRLRQLRELRMKEIHSWFILRELFLLLLFLGALYAISFANRNVSEAHRIVNHLRHHFLDHDMFHAHNYSGAVQNKMYVFSNIRSINDYWSWIEKIFVPRVQEVLWSDGKQNRTFWLQHDRTNLMIGWPRLRQLRVKNGRNLSVKRFVLSSKTLLESCPKKVLSGHMEITDCQLGYKWYDEGRSPFGRGINHSALNSAPFKYKSAEELDGYPYSTSDATYTGGGYVYDMKTDETKRWTNTLRFLQEHQWIDRQTRAVFLTFGLYNANSNLFVYCSLLLEQLPGTGKLILRPSFQPFKLLQLYSGTDVIYCLIYLVLIIYYMNTEVRLFLEKRKTYMRQFWSYINWIIIVCSWMGAGVHFYREAERKRMGNALRSKPVDNPVSLQLFSYLDNFLTYLLGFCCFFGTIKM